MRTRFLLFVVLLNVIPSLVTATSLRPVPATETGYTDQCLFTEGQAQDICDVAILAVPSPYDLVGVRFSVYTQNVSWVPVGVLSNYTTVGNWTDLSVGFGSCVTTPVVAATVRYLSPGMSPCGTVNVGSAPLFGAPLGSRCDFTEFSIAGGSMTVNGVYDTPPGGFDPDCFCPPVATKQSTWGQVKALYR